MNDEEISAGGSRMYRHDQAEQGPVSGGDGVLIDGMDAHLDRCFGAEQRVVFHEIVSLTVHVDVHLVRPSDAFPFNRLVTTGMAERPMNHPEALPRHAELSIALPAGWPLEHDDFADERNYWPLRLLKQLARFPHEYSTFLWYGHTIPNGDPPTRYAASTPLCCALILPIITAPDGFDTVELTDGRSVAILGVTALHDDEMRFKLERGTDALLALFDERDMDDVIDPTRSSVVPRKRRLFGR